MSKQIFVKCRYIILLQNVTDREKKDNNKKQKCFYYKMKFFV